ncbi:MAG TPA: hypothetical protein VKX49_32145 [Bryobacteraceae bacterium]|nr:hypothetical protein [Bryobacteraceae bacterium]
MRFARLSSLLILAAGGTAPVFAHDPITTQITWNREISRIVYNRCGSCHHKGGEASDIDLMTYKDARPWAKAIKEEVLERRMPPFAAVKGFGPVKDGDALTQEELHLIADWVEGGSPEGDDPKLLPKIPDYDDANKAPAVAAKTAAPGGAGGKAEAPQLTVDGTLTLKQPVTLIGARAGMLAEGASIQAVVQKPDGSIEPLIWIYDYKPKFDRAYYFQVPVKLPEGSKIEVYPAGHGSLAFLANK